MGAKGNNRELLSLLPSNKKFSLPQEARIKIMIVGQVCSFQGARVLLPVQSEYCKCGHSDLDHFDDDASKPRICFRCACGQYTPTLEGKNMTVVAGIKHDIEDGCPGMSPILVEARILKLNQRVLPAENV